MSEYSAARRVRVDVPLSVTVFSRPVMMRWLGWLGLGLVGWLTSGAAQADIPLRVARADEKLRVDGALREWRGARFVALGSGEGSLRYALGHRDGGLYLAAEVEDAKVVRSRGVGAGQDALVLTLAMPSRSGTLVTTEVWLHPGVTGSSAASAGLARPGARPKPNKQIAVVEGPRDAGRGYVLEAFIPWAVVGEADLWQMGRAALRYEDSERPGKARVGAESAPAQRPEDMPRFVMGEGELDLVQGFLDEHGRGAAVLRFDLKGDVLGDARAERVTLADRYVIVTGPAIEQGTSFLYEELPLGTGGSVRDARLVDLTGDGKAELVMALKQKNQLGTRTLWSVTSLSGGAPKRVFAVEIEKGVAGGELRTSLDLGKARRGQPTPIVVRRGQARGLDAERYHETPAQDAEPILLPWGPVLRRVYRYEGERFVMVDEDREAEREAPQPAVETAMPASPVTPAAVAPALSAVLASGKQAAGVPGAQRPDHHLRVNMAGDKQLEDLYVFGSHVILVGPGVGEGASYFLYGAPVGDAQDVRDVGSGDVTGDGRDELLLRVRQSLGGDGVEREVLLVQQVGPRGFTRVLAVEIARWQGNKRIDNRVAVRAGTLRIHSGKAQGWSASDYPFPDEPVGGVGRLLLPWKREAVEYRLQGGRLEPQ